MNLWSGGCGNHIDTFCHPNFRANASTGRTHPPPPPKTLRTCRAPRLRQESGLGPQDATVSKQAADLGAVWRVRTGAFPHVPRLVWEYHAACVLHRNLTKSVLLCRRTHPRLCCLSWEVPLPVRVAGEGGDPGERGTFVSNHSTSSCLPLHVCFARTHDHLSRILVPQSP